MKKNEEVDLLHILSNYCRACQILKRGGVGLYLLQCGVVDCMRVYDGDGMPQNVVDLFQKNRDCLALITQYILSTPWCEEGQEAYDSTGTLQGFFDALELFANQRGGFA